MTDAAREILVAGARAVAHEDGVEPTLATLLEVVCVQLDVLSAAIVIEPGSGEPAAIVATFGLGEAATAGLAEAMRNPMHPIVRTAATAVATFDVLPTVPGGPALRSHLPLTVTRGDAERLVGVVAIAHDRPFDVAARRLLQAGADLAAVALERGRP